MGIVIQEVLQYSFDRGLIARKLKKLLIPMEDILVLKFKSMIKIYF